jgi:hypoxanthine-guanine phosphoribosyltransferase
VYIKDKKFDLFLDSNSVDDIINQVAIKLKKQIIISKQPVILLVVLKGATTFAVKLTEKLYDIDYGKIITNYDELVEIKNKRYPTRLKPVSGLFIETSSK